MASVRQFEDLDAWKMARELANMIYDFAKIGPLARDFGLRDQMQRSAISVMSNIAEGFERDTTPDFVHFLFIAKGSAGELRSQLYLAHDQQFLPQDQFDSAIALCRRTSLLISNLITYLKGKVQNER